LDENLKILIQKCQQSNNGAQAELYKRFSANLFSVCLRYTDNREDAKDCFQDGFIMIFNKLSQFRFEGSFEGWMRRIMVNSCLEKYRNRNHLYVVNEEITADQSLDEVMEDEMEDYSYEQLLEIIRQLPDRYRQVFNLYAIENFSHQDIAEMLHISVGTSKSNLSRAKEKLKELLKKNNEIKVLSK
jgi:RNA polymerase sigma factor (sigma-70 family)